MYFESSEEFSVRLRHLLKEKNIRPSELAEALNVTRGTVSLWLSGKRNPNEDTKDEICRILDISYLELLHTKSEISFARIRFLFDKFNLEVDKFERFEELELELANYFLKIMHKYMKDL